MGSRFDYSSDESELMAPRRGIGRDFEDAGSEPPTPSVKKRNSFSQMFRRGISRASTRDSTLEPASSGINDMEAAQHRSSIGSKASGKEKRFQGLRKLFRIRE
jgi:hypothetical protein